MSLSRALLFSLSSTGLATFLLLVDHVLYHWSPLQHRRVLKAICDNLAHGAVGGWCWANTIMLLGQPIPCHVALVEVTVGVFFGCVIDVDHFLEARSLSVMDALSLKGPRRSFAHNTLLVLIATALLLFLTQYFRTSHHYPILRNIPFIFFLATLSHHLRDAERRGIWFSAWCTPPIPHKLYILLILLLPLLVHLPLKLSSPVSLPSHSPASRTFIV